MRRLYGFPGMVTHHELAVGEARETGQVEAIPDVFLVILCGAREKS